MGVSIDDSGRQLDPLSFNVDDPYSLIEILGYASELNWEIYPENVGYCMESIYGPGEFVEKILAPMEHARRKYFSSDEWHIEVYERMEGDELVLKKEYDEAISGMHEEVPAIDPSEVNMPDLASSIEVMMDECELEVIASIDRSIEEIVDLSLF